MKSNQKQLNRRDFLSEAITILGGLALLNNTTLGKTYSAKSKKILVLGGTNFVGPAIVKELLKRNHEVTLFNRGLTNPTLFPKLEKLKGDRTISAEEGLSALKNRKWDVVIDTWVKDASLIRKSTKFLKDQTEHYVFVSSIAVYSNYKEIGINEQSRIRGGVEGRTDDYGAQKVFCEREVQTVFPNRTTIVRPCAIVGDRNPDDSFRYWTIRIKRGGEIFAPGNGDDPIQFIDVKDVAKWIVTTAEQKLFGVFNTIGPMEKLTWRTFLENCVKVINKKTKLIWMDEAFLRENKIYSFSDVPLWAPLSEDPGFAQISGKKVFEKGFSTRPLAETIKDSLNWFKTNLPADHKFGNQNNSAGITYEQEQQLIEKWKAKIK